MNPIVSFLRIDQVKHIIGFSQHVMRSVAILIFLSYSALQAQTVQCVASVEQSVIEQGTSFQLRIEVSGENLRITSLPQLPEMKGLEVMHQGAGESTSISIINGRRSMSKSYDFILRAKDVGRWTIPPVAVGVDGKTVSSQALTIEVVPGGSISGSQRSEKTNDAFLALTVSKKEAFQGEQITAELKIYSRIPITQYAPSRMPGFTGFWAEEFPMPQQIQSTREQINGVAYAVYTIKRVGLFATRSGLLTIDPSEIECELRIPRRSRNSLDDLFSPFGDPFGQTATVKLQSEPVKLNILPLPKENAPSDFSGLVGQFDVKTAVDKNSLKTGEALTYTITISGTGNIKSAEIPPTPFGDDFERYDPKSSETLNKNSNLVSGSKVFEYVGVPRLPRQVEIPVFNLSYYDPVLKKYVTKSSGPHRVTIAQGTGGGIFSHNALSKEEIALLAKDIRFIKTENLSEESYAPVYFRWWFIAGMIFPLLLWGTVYVWAIKHEELQKDGIGLRYRKASPLARKRLKAAEALMKSNQQDSFYTELSKTLNGLITDKLHVGENVYTREHITEILRERNVENNLITEYMDCMHMCDEARFSPDGKSRARMDDAYERIRAAILNMDNAL